MRAATDSRSRISAAQVHRLRVTPQTLWVVVEVTTSDGRTGLGDATLHEGPDEVCSGLERQASGLVGQAVHASLAQLAAVPREGLIEAAAVCALDQALHDLAAQQYGVSIAGLLCETPRAATHVYANINRRTSDRSEYGFAASAAQAVAAGFDAVKIAPFDGLTPATAGPGLTALLDAAFARMAAVRATLGPLRLMIDCHWRLPAQVLPVVAGICAELGADWLECPFPETPDRHADIRRARAALNARGIRLAGGEFQVGRAAFAELVAAGCYDVLMPDMRYVGGYAEFLAVARCAADAGVGISPHNPAGPVCHSHSVHAAAACENVSTLETQFDETPAFAAIVAGDLPVARDGWVHTPRSPGLGLRLDRVVITPFRDAAPSTAPIAAAGGPFPRGRHDPEGV